MIFGGPPKEKKGGDDPQYCPPGPPCDCSLTPAMTAAGSNNLVKGGKAVKLLNSHFSTGTVEVLDIGLLLTKIKLWV